MSNLKSFAILLMLCIFFSCRTSKMGKVKRSEDGKIVNGITRLRCTYPSKSYSKVLDFKVKANIDSLSKVPYNKLDVAVSQTISTLSGYTSEGLDLDLFLFRLCEMANNRGLSPKQTQSLLFSAMNKWNTSEEIKKKVADLEIKENQRQQREFAEEEKKITAPELDIRLIILDSCFYAQTIFENNIPIEYRLKLDGLISRNDFIVTSWPFSSISPESSKKWITLVDCPLKFVRPANGISQLKLTYEYKSVYYPLTSDSKLKGQIVKTYIFDWNNFLLKEK
jgi:hypothetical protein